MRMITNTHLKSHGLTKQQYMDKWKVNNLACEELREVYRKRSEKTNKSKTGIKRSEEVCNNIKKGIRKTFDNGREAHNKGKPMSDDQKEKLHFLARKRNHDWKSAGNHPLLGHDVSEETRKRISASISKYAENNPQEMIFRGQKSLKTKQENGYDFSSPMKGKPHSDETKLLISELSKKRFSEKRDIIIQEKETKMESLGYTILSKDEKSWFYFLKCQCCNKEFSTTRQNFNDSKIGGNCFICPSDIMGKSKAELKILHDLESLLGRKLISGDRKIIWPKELDILDPVSNIAIEYCGLNTHGEEPRDKRFKDQGKNQFYHLNKMIESNNKGIDLITIFSDEFLNHPNIVMSILKNKMGITPISIMARKTEVVKLTSDKCRSFLKENHIMGAGRSTEKYGLIYNNELVAVMTFIKGDISHKGSEWEINRFASKIDTSIIGGASKLFNKFRKDVNPETVVTFADLRWGKGSVYERMGFVHEYNSPPNYWYHDNTKRYHRFGLRKNSNDNPLLTEWENRKNQGWDRIWDCGHAKYVWKPNI